MPPALALSLYQHPRIGLEEKLFLPGLRASNIWYGHSGTVCWMQSELPDGFATQMAAQGLAKSYEESGWCALECAREA